MSAIEPMKPVKIIPLRSFSLPGEGYDSIASLEWELVDGVSFVGVKIAWEFEDWWPQGLCFECVYLVYMRAFASPTPLLYPRL